MASPPEKDRPVFPDGFTARQRIAGEKDRRENQELLEKLISVMPDVLVRMNLQGEILFVNDAALCIGNYEPQDMIGKNMLDFIAPEDHKKAMENTLLMFKKKTRSPKIPSRYEGRNKTPL